jgi:hypothetical protein
MNPVQRPLINEDWLSLWIGLFVFTLSLGLFIDVDILGWGIKTNVWNEISVSTTTVSKFYESLPGIVSLFITYVFLLLIVGLGVKALGTNFKDFILPFTIIFFISYFCWFLGHYAYIAATSNQLDKFSIPWSLNLTGEAGYIIALIAGLVI